MTTLPITTTLIRRDPPDTRWLAECTVDGVTVRRRAHSREAAIDAVRLALPTAHDIRTPHT